MASVCPRCHKILEEDEICCAQIRFTWRCANCFKIGAGYAIPYGNCFMCGGPLQVISQRKMDEQTRRHVIHDAVQLQLSLLKFYTLARDRAVHPEQQQVLDGLSEAALERLHELKARYRAHIGRSMADCVSREDELARHWALLGIRVKDDEDLAEMLEDAIEVERRARDHFCRLECEFPSGIGNDLCRELEADADEDIAMIQTEIQQLA